MKKMKRPITDPCFLTTVFIAGLAIALGCFIYWPCPEISARLTQWRTTDASYFTRNAKTIFFKDKKGSGKLERSGTLVLLHGFPTASYDWIKIWDGLADQFDRVITLDFLGFGFSDKPRNYNYSIMEQADIVENLLTVLAVKSFHLLTHDYGDTVGQELLARHNEGKSRVKLQSVCLLNGGIFSDIYQPRPIQKLLTLSPLLGRTISLLSNRFLFTNQISALFGPQSQPETEEFYDYWCLSCYMDGYANAADLLGYMAERSANGRRWKGALQNADVPVHMIYGPADPVNPPAFIDYYKKEIPEPSIDVMDASIGHYPQFEDGPSVLKIYLHFIEKLPKS